MIHSRTGFGLLLAILALQEGALRLSPSQIPSNRKQQVRSGCPTPGAPVPISPDRPAACDLQSGDEHVFRIALNAGDFFQLRVKQRGVDALVTVVDPAGKILLRMDSPNGGEGEEPVLALADRAGEHRLIVAGTGMGWSGSYLLSMQQPRPAGRVDRVRVAALRKMAEGDLSASLEAWESVHDAWGQILVLERIALLLMDQQAYIEALAVCGEGTMLARNLGDLVAEGRFTNLAGLARRNLREREKARDLFKRALELSEQGGDSVGQALALNNLGLLAEDQGNLQQALDHYSASLDLWEREVDDPGQHANTLANLGEIYLAMGEPKAALRSFSNALNLAKRADQRDVHYAVVDSAGMAFADLGLPKKAFWNYRLALGLARKPEQRARTLFRLGLVYREERDFLKASKALEEVLQIALSEEDHRYEAYALAELAHIDHLQGRTAEALRKFEQAHTLFEELGDQLYVASSLFGRAEVEQDLGRLQDGVASVERSIGIVESLRAELDPRLRVSFFASRHRFYRLYVELLMELRRPEQALEANENARGRTLLDDVAGKGGPATEAMTLEEIQRELLDRDTLLLVYSLGKRRSYLWVVSRDAIRPFKLPSREVVEKAALQMWHGLSTKDGKPDVRALSRMLLPPELDLTPRTRLLVIPDGALHLIPFAALLGPDGRRLVFNHPTAYEPSASVLVGMRRKHGSRPPAPKTIAVFADPVFEHDDTRFPGNIPPVPREEGESRSPGIGDLERLPSSRREARAILKLFPEKDRFEALDFSANRSTALDPAFRQYRILHFATHHLSGVDPDRAGLILSLFDRQGRPIEGLLRATEVYNLDLPAELVVLSACGTGLAEEVQGEGPMGLARAFLHAGAKRVVVSLWDVEDGATAELMTRFYRSMLQDGLPAAAALRAAQASMADDPDWKDPRHWAPFILIGEPD